MWRRRITLATVATVLLISTVPGAAEGVTVVAAGDIACADEPCPAQIDTARVARRQAPDAALTLGDHQYERGALKEFRASYDPTWGKMRGLTFPTPGNHEYDTPHANGYFAYFHKRAHGPRGFYSFSLDTWQVLSFNSERAIDRQRDWARNRLRSGTGTCELAYWHRPRWSSSRGNGGSDASARWWQILYRHGVDVVLNGHAHQYERFGKLDPDGRLDPDGIREFVVGTGGRSLYRFGRPATGSKARIRRFGVLKLELRAASYTWRFLSRNGVVLDRGETNCR
ncbi:MAG: metallophosphoesterase [Actinomycetota bacterium]